MYTKKRIKKSITKLHKRIYRTNRDHNLSTLYIIIAVLGILFVFPAIVNTVVTLVILTVVTGLGLISYVVINRTLDYRQRSLPERLIGALPIESYKYRSTAKVLGSSNQQWKVIEPKQLETKDDDIIDVIPTVKQLSLPEAIKQSTSDSWLIGQNDYGQCQINIYDLVHLGLIGATGTGKSSSTALLIMLHALRNNFHVIALDAKSVDWERYNSHIEAYSTDYLTFPNQVDQLCLIHEQRMIEVKNHGVSNIDELPYKLPHVLVILEEFGYLCQSLKAANKQQYEQTISQLSNLMRVSRSSGINLLIVDQKPNGWHNSITANVKGFICYRIKGQLGNAIGEYHLDKLAAKGEFSYEGDAYRAWFTKADIQELLKGMSKSKVRLLSDAKHVDTLKDEKIVDVLKETRDIDKSNAAIGGPHTTTLHYNNNSPKLSKAITNRKEFVDSLITLIKSGESINDTRLRQLHKDWYQKSIDGNSSRLILDYINQQLDPSNSQ